MKTIHSLSVTKKRHDSTVLIDWLKGLAKCHLAVTVTFGVSPHSTATSPSKRTVEEILRKGIKRINTLCYRNLVKRKGYSIGAIAVIEGGGPYERIHAHIGFELPPDRSLNWFRSLVTRVFKPSKWIEMRPHIDECWNENWINYMLKFGQEAFLPSCCLIAKHRGA